MKVSIKPLGPISDVRIDGAVFDGVYDVEFRHLVGNPPDLVFYCRADELLKDGFDVEADEFIVQIGERRYKLTAIPEDPDEQARP